MKGFHLPEQADGEYLIRRERLKSEIEQSRAGQHDPKLDLLKKELDDLRGDRPMPMLC
jgi:hypothetical protein